MTMEFAVRQGVHGGVHRHHMDAAKDEARAAAAAPSSALCTIVLRLIAVATTIVAAVVMGTASETKTVSIQVAPTLPPLPVPATAKSSYSSAFVYFTVANAIAFAYSACSLAVVVLRRENTTRSLILPVSVLDSVMVALLFSGNGAAASFAVLGQYGNSHVGWNKVCDVYGRFCAQASASMAVSLVGSLAFLLLVMLSILGLHRRSSPS